MIIRPVLSFIGIKMHRKEKIYALNININPIHLLISSI